MEFIYDYTGDGLRLQSTLWRGKTNDICVICIHGMGENVIENYFANIIGNKLSNNNISFMYGHTRGYSHINDIFTKDGTCKRIGTTYEIFEECIYDIDLWVNKAMEFGYKRIILMGHSLGCNKVIYYLSNNHLKKVCNIDSIILASAPDLRGKLQTSIKNYDKLIAEAKENVDNKNPKKILSSSIYNWYDLSSQTFLSLYSKDSKCNNLPIKDNEKVFEQLSVIDIPILTFSGEHEHKLYHKMDLIKEKAISCKDFTYNIIKGTGHVYTDKEKEVADVIINWIKGIF